MPVLTLSIQLQDGKEEKHKDARSDHASMPVSPILVAHCQVCDTLCLPPTSLLSGEG